jgi:hypothetical protein
LGRVAGEHPARAHGLRHDGTGSESGAHIAGAMSRTAAACAEAPENTIGGGRLAGAAISGHVVIEYPS